MSFQDSGGVDRFVLRKRVSFRMLKIIFSAFFFFFFWMLVTVVIVMIHNKGVFEHFFSFFFFRQGIPWLTS